MNQSFIKSKAFKSNALVAFIVAVVFSLLVSVTLGLGLAFGYALTCIFTSIDLASATICSLLAVGITIWCVVQFSMSIERVRKDLETDLTDDDDDSDFLTEDQVDTIAERLTEAFLMRFPSSQTRTRRNSGRIR